MKIEVVQHGTAPSGFVDIGFLLVHEKMHLAKNVRFVGIPSWELRYISLQKKNGTFEDDDFPNFSFGRIWTTSPWRVVLGMAFFLCINPERLHQIT